MHGDICRVWEGRFTALAFDYMIISLCCYFVFHISDICYYQADLIYIHAQTGHEVGQIYSSLYCLFGK